MTGKDMAALIGQEAQFRCNEGIQVQVRIVDAKVSYGALRVQITPMAGDGVTWVDRSRVSLRTNQAPA